MRVPTRVALVTSSSALGLALIAATPAAYAQTLYGGPLVTVPAHTIMQPVAETVQTTETVRTVRPATARHVRQVVTTRTITRQMVPTASVVARTVTSGPLYDYAGATPPQQPLYDYAGTAPIAASSDGGYSRPLYDEVVDTPAPAVQSQWSQPFVYRYVYEPDRILVIDPTTNIAVQSIPR